MIVALDNVQDPAHSGPTTLRLALGASFGAGRKVELTARSLTATTGITLGGQQGGSGMVFEVTAVETVNQEIPGTRSATAKTLKIVRDGETLDASRKPWTVFSLSEAGTIDKVTPAVQQGRYLRADDVRQALTTSRLTVPTLDEAFPTRK